MSLNEISPLTFSIGNTMKRVTVIVSSIIIFHTQVRPINAAGAAIAIIGTFLYSQVILCWPHFDSFISKSSACEDIVRFSDCCGQCIVQFLFLTLCYLVLCRLSNKFVTLASLTRFCKSVLWLLGAYFYTVKEASDVNLCIHDCLLCKLMSHTQIVAWLSCMSTVSCKWKTYLDVPFLWYRYFTVNGTIMPSFNTHLPMLALTSNKDIFCFLCSVSLQ